MRLIEEVVMVLGSMRVGTDGRVEECEEGRLTTARIQYKLCGETRNIYVAGITDVRIVRRLFKRCLKIKCGGVAYYLSVDNLDKLYNELLRVIKLNGECTVYTKSDSVGGITRVISSHNERASEAEALKSAALHDLETLKNKCQSLLKLVKKIKPPNQNDQISNLFKHLGINNIFDPRTTDRCEDVSKIQINEDIFPSMTPPIEVPGDHLQPTADNSNPTPHSDVIQGSDVGSKVEGSVQRERTVLARRRDPARSHGAMGVRGSVLLDTLDRLLSVNEMVLLMDLYCAVNSLLLCDLYSPRELYNHVMAITSEGKYKLIYLNDLYVIVRSIANEFDYFKDVVKILDERPISIHEFALLKNISITLAQVKIFLAESYGYVIKDESIQQTIYYKNIFS